MLHLFILWAIVPLAQAEFPPEGEGVTITAAPAFANARPCLQSCLNGGVYNCCGWEFQKDPQQIVACSRNSCLCRPDLQETIYAQITACVNYACGNQLELSSGMDILTNYCKAYYATAAPYPTTTSNLLRPSIAAPTVTQTITASSTTIIYRSSSPPPSNCEWASYHHLRLGVLLAITLLLSSNSWI